MIELSALRSLRAVDTHGSVVAAAASLGFTPSAVSQQVKRLERQAGVPLLERVGRGVMLTGHGRRLVADGSRLLGELESLEAELQHEAGRVAGQLRIAAFSTATRGLVAPVVRTLLDAHPDLRLTLTETEPWDTVELVATGQQEIGIVHRWGDVPLSIPEHLVATSIGHDVADVVLPAGHPLGSRERLSPLDLVDEPWVATPEGTICREWLVRMYVGTGRSPRIAHVAMEFDSHLALVGAGLGIALVPRLGRRPLTPDVVAVPAHRPVPTRDVIVVRRASMARSPAVEAVVAALRSAAVS
ncbi:LysR family transcriptional regulator [Nocardioides euryhalodurans]|uniref:LysR family transcriptional regulator n=1 Tax=Nocardioides euryhalodurans TaxID=2518370 RepID=A0A4P7GJ74_9ACTN|nr:LysR family transcriptional regulator [Nocardioides euryhalodurans]QBR91681.1 LysR family transcriptional regulator [Nocardioides euryhalodurans]